MLLKLVLRVQMFQGIETPSSHSNQILLEPDNATLCCGYWIYVWFLEGTLYGRAGALKRMENSSFH